MTNRTCAVDGCNNPTPDTSLACNACWNQHRQRLAGLPWLIDETTLTLARQNSASGHNNTRRADTPLPYSQPASDALTALLGTLRAWALLADDEGHHIPRLGTLNAATISRRLLTLDYHGWPHNHDAAPDYIRELRTHSNQLWRIIDTQAEPAYTGPCPTCGTDLYVRKGAPAATCHECDTATDLRELHERIIEAALALTWTVHEAARLLHGAGYMRLEPVDVARWTRQGRITPTGHTPDGAPLYRLTDLQHVARQTQDVAR